MFGQRLLVTLVLSPIGIAAIMLGGWWYGGLVAVVLARAAWEYAALFRAGGAQPATWVLLTGVLAIVLARFMYGFAQDSWLLAFLAMLTLSVHLVSYERGRDQAGTDFAATLSGIFYIGLLGSFLILVRNLPTGEWWVMLTFFAVWLADTAAYLVGTPLGKHRLAPRLSPKKSWEGYLAGILFGALLTPMFLLLFRRFGLPDNPAFSPENAAMLGVALGILPTLGDLGESMIKRQMKVKDASQLLPGHGGILDRIDSWLWAFPIGYFMILYLFLKGG
ncbi:MAG: phosphatidate cytidylyltransferase [Anaerolineales bacterium]